MIAMFVLLTVHTASVRASDKLQSDPCRAATALHILMDSECRADDLDGVYSRLLDTHSVLPGQSLNFGYSTGCLWILASVTPSPSVDLCWFEVGSSYINQIQVYNISKLSGIFPVADLGDNKPFKDRIIKHRNFVFPYQTSLEKQEFLFQAQSASTLSFALRIGLAQEMAEHYFNDYIIAGLFYGSMIFFAIYGLWAYVVLKKVSFLFYGAFAASIALFFCARDGIGFQFFWPENIWWQSHGVRIVALISAALGVIYARSFLHHSLFSVGWAGKLATAYWILIAIALVVVCAKPLSETHSLVIVLSSLSPVLMATLAIFSDGIKTFVGRSILLSSLVSFGGVLIYSLSVNHLILTSIYTEYAMQAASIIEFMIIASAIARHISDIRLENSRAEIEKSKAVYRSEMMENLAHDLKNPLAVFELIARSKTWEDFLTWRLDLEKAIERIHGIIANFRKDHILDPIKRSTAALNLTEIAAEAAKIANSNSVSITADHSLDDLSLFIDHVAIERALFNLIKNAVEAGAKNIHLVSFCRDNDVVLEVQDDGPGVDSVLINDLFQRGKSFGKDGGQGIGLYNVRRTAEGHDGTAEYLRINETSTFRMLLPSAVMADLSDQRSSAKTPTMLEQPKHLSVLVAVRDIGRKDALLAALANYPFKIYLKDTKEVIPSFVFTDNHEIMEKYMSIGVPIMMENGKDDPEKIARQIARRVRSQKLPRKFVEIMEAKDSVPLRGGVECEDC